MSKKPKKSEYKASASEKAEASISLAEHQRYKKLYEPVLTGWREDSEKDFQGLLRGRAGADIAQATTGQMPSVGAVESPGLAPERASLAAKAMLAGSVQGKEIQTGLQTNVLAAARKQVSDTQTGLGQAARIGASNVIAAASDKQLVRGAIGGALASVGTAGYMKLKQGKGKNQQYSNTDIYGAVSSDIRLKEAIEYLGKSSNGHNIYTWNWNDKAIELGINDPTTGVLAQEIMETNPDTVTKGIHGYYVVNYSLLFGGG